MLAAALAAGPSRLDAGEYRLALDGVLGAWSYEDFFQRGVDGEARTLGGVGLHLGLGYMVPRLELTLDYAPTHRRDVEGEDFSATAHVLGFGLQATPSERTVWTVTERLIQSDTFELIEATQPETSLVPERSDRLNHRFHVDVAHDLTRRALFVAGAEHQAKLYDSEDLFDGRSTGVFVGGGYRLARDQELRLVAEGRRFDLRFGDEDAEEIDLDVVYLAELGRRGRLELQGGAHRVDTVVEVTIEQPDGGELERSLEPREVDGWHGAAELRLDGDRVDGTAGVGHYVGSGAGFGQPLLVDEVTAGLAFLLHPDVRLSLDGRHTRSELLVEETRANRVSVGALSLHWNPVAPLRLTGGYSIVRQESRLLGFPDLEDRRWFFTVGFRILELGAHELREERP